MRRVVLLTLLGTLLNFGIVVAQLMDTTYLREVRIYGLPVNAYATGSKIEQLKTGDEVATLSDKLINETSLYLKTYGNNQLSTITIRGTTASQTAVLWNGVNINSPTLGQTDFSLIPLFFFDEISIRYGAASSLYGSDAIGGSIMIGQQPALFQKGFNGTVYQQLGSFGKFNTGVKATYGTSRWELRTKLYNAYIKNDFPYTSPAVGYEKKQNHASVENFGVDQQVNFKISDTQQVTLEGMYTRNFREIQPAVTNDQSDETLRDGHIRLSLNYQNESRFGVLSVTGAFIDSDQDYTNDETSTVRSKQFTTMASMDKVISARSSLRYGLSYAHYRASAENYGGTVSENRYDGFASFRYALLPNWLMNISVRQSLYASRYAPFAPTVGTEVHVIDKEKNKLVLRAQAARGYRVPTLNDRYWVPGGNPAVTPEDAYQLEGGVNWTRSSQAWRLSLDGAAYRGWVSEMIVWLPVDNIWSPSNLQKVDLYGAEVNAKAVFTTPRYQVRGNILYSYTRSINKEGVSGLTDKQLAYVPIHSARVSASWRVSTWEVGMRVNLTGLRYTTLDNERTQALDPYALTDVSLGKTLSLHRVSLKLLAEANNLFNVYYENLENHAMPGRYYSFGITINFNNTKPL